MISDKIYVNNKGEGMAEALDETERFAEYQHFSAQAMLHLRLLSEEMLGMVRAITHEFSALFWIEEDGSRTEIHLHAKTEMNRTKRNDLLSVSTTGKNASATTIMGKIREMIEVGLENYEEVDQLQMDYGSVGNLAYGVWGMENVEGGANVAYNWSLRKYRNSVNENLVGDEVAGLAWDELEKSIIAKLADDVHVGISKGEVQMVIYKQF